MVTPTRQQLSRSVTLSQRAHAFRQNPTRTEALLWSALRAGQLGVTFRRQVVVGGRYIADFVASSVRVIVEIDGGYHERRRTADARRDRDLRRLGYTVLHLTAEAVERQLEGAVAEVRMAIESTLVP
ncbi:MAG: DUF559 domain-containing protein [Polyangiaceae bacterium]